MKKILASLLMLFSLSVAAEPGVTLPKEEFVLREVYAENGDGGIITLTNIPCNIEGNPLYGHGWIIKTELLGDVVMDGCWIFAQDQPVLLVFWSNFQKTIIKDPDAKFSLVKPTPKPKRDSI